MSAPQLRDESLPPLTLTRQPESSQDALSSQASQCSPSSARDVAAVFRALDANNRGVLDYRAALAGLSQLGVANGQDTVRTVSGLLGMNSPSQLSNHQCTLPEFVACYEMLSRAQHKPSRLDQAVLYSRASQVSGADNEKVLKLVYTNYCRYTVGQGKLIFDEADPKMSSMQFVKLCCDLGVLQPAGPLTMVMVDLIFHKCKPQGNNHFQYPDFLKALDAIGAQSELCAMDLIYILGIQIKPSQQFFAPKPLTSQPKEPKEPKEPYDPRKGLRPSTAWGRSSSARGAGMYGEGKALAKHTNDDHALFNILP